MSLEIKINEAIKEAMKAKNEGALRGLRGIKSAIILAKTEKGSSGELTEERENALLQKMHKQRKESFDIFVTQQRDDLALKEKEEMEVIELFLPKQMSEEELAVKIAQIIASSGASSLKDMGKVIGLSNKEFAGKADGQRIAAVVKKLLGV